MSSSIESDRGSIANALGAFERQDELVSPIRSYAIDPTIDTHCSAAITHVADST